MHVSDSILVASVAALIPVLSRHSNMSGRLPRRQIGSVYLQLSEDARSGMRSDLDGADLNTLVHTVKYRDLCLPSHFTTVDGETERTSTGDMLALYQMGNGSTYGMLLTCAYMTLTLTHCVLTCMPVC